MVLSSYNAVGNAITGGLIGFMTLTTIVFVSLKHGSPG
jgi:hypothetical protein